MIDDPTPIGEVKKVVERLTVRSSISDNYAPLFLE